MFSGITLCFPERPPYPAPTPYSTSLSSLLTPWLTQQGQVTDESLNHQFWGWMAQCLRAFAALEDPTSAPSTLLSSQASVTPGTGDLIPSSGHRG